MRNAMLLLALPPLLLLGACEVKVGDKDKTAAAGTDGASVSIDAGGNVAIAAKDGADGMSISVPGFEGKMKIPGLELGGDNMDIDGMKLYPGTKLSGINVTDRSTEGNGVVHMRFTSPAAPDKVSAYYADAARNADFTNIVVNKANGAVKLTANKTDGDALTITMNPAQGGSAGDIMVRDTNGK